MADDPRNPAPFDRPEDGAWPHWEAQIAAEVLTPERDYAGTPPLVAAARRTQARIDAISIDNECEHGRLPGDPSPACGCFAEEQAA